MDLETEPADEGDLRYTKIYVIDRGAYCPGFIQALLVLLPTPEPHWDDLGVRPELDTFTRKLRDRLRAERSRQPHAILRLSFSHTRREVLAPHVIRILDADH
jgi:hypothetical protein